MRSIVRHITLVLASAALSLLAGVQAYAQTAAGTRIGNVADVRFGFANGDSLVLRSDTAVVFVQDDVPAPASLQITKSASAISIIPGGAFSYTIVVRNGGATKLTLVSIVDTIDAAALQVQSASRGQVSGNVFAWTIDTLAAGAVDSVTISVSMSPTAIEGVRVMNVASATALETGPVPVQDSVSVGVANRPFVPNPLGSVTKTGRSLASSRDTVVYTITAANTGNVALANAAVVDSLDHVMRFVAATPPPTSVDTAAGVLLWAIGVVDTQETRTITVLVRYADSLTSDRRVTNVAGFKGDEIGWVRASATTDVTVPIIVPAEPRLGLVKRVSASSIPTGGLATYTLVVSNSGNATATNVAVVDTLPTAVQAVSVGSPGALGGRIVTAKFDSLEPGQSDSLSIVVRLMDGVTDGEMVRNTAVATSDQTTIVSSSASFASIRTSNSSCKIVVSVTPSLVIGNGIAASVIRASVSDTLGVPKADGTPVVFRTSIGYFSNGRDSITVATINGVAVDSVRAVISSSSIVTAQASISVNEALCFANQTVDIVFFPGAIAGLVNNAWTGTPEQNATIRVYNSAGVLVAEIRPAADGSYLVPVPRTDDYQVQITTTDVFGQTTTIRSDVTVVVPGTGGRPPVLNTIVVSGRVYYYVSRKPIAAAGVPVFLTISPAGSGAAVSDRTFAGHSVVDTTVTDSTGYYQFQGLPPGVRYEVMVADPSLTGSISINPLSPGELMKDVNIPIVLNPAIHLTKSGPARAFTNDTVSYTIVLRNTGNYSATNVVLRDSLDRAMRFVSATPAPFAVDSASGIVRWAVGTLDSSAGPQSVYTAIVRVRFADTLRADHRAVNVAGMTSDQTTDTLVQVQTSIIRSVLGITKAARRKIVEVGDQAIYTVSVRNTSSDLVLRSVTLEDRAPLGFVYLPGTSFQDSTRTADPSVSRVPGGQILRWNIADSLAAGGSASISYRMVVGAGAGEGDGINRAQAYASEPNGAIVASPMAEERVEVQAGVFTDRGVVVGKVFYDPNRNAYQDEGESGVKGIELMTEDGTRIVTGDDGKYSIPEITPGRHVIKVRRHTLPAMATLHAGFNDFAFDPASRFVDVTPGGIARADFYLDAPLPNDTVAFVQRVDRFGVVKVQRFVSPKNVTFIDDERPALMKLTGLNFEVGKAVLRPEAYPVIRQLADILRENPDERVVIMGHTDASPIRTAEFPNNRVLSIARAEAVKVVLSNVEGIDITRIQTQGFGESVPVATNATREGKALNRRVEFSFGPAKDPSAVRQDAAVMVRIPVSYRGGPALNAIEITDSLPALMTYVEGSGRFNGRRVRAAHADGHLIWTIDSVGSELSGDLVYQVRLPRPVAGVEVHQSSTLGLRLMAAETVTVAAHLPTENRSAIAVRGRAVNYLMPSVLFASGKATLQPGAISALEATAAMLKNDRSLTAVIEGHTDAVPIRSKQFPSNLELSHARATTIVDILVGSFGIDRGRLEAVGYGEFRPVETNATPEGRQANRRIEMRLVRDEFSTSVLPEGGVDSTRTHDSEVAPNPSSAPLSAETQVSPADRLVITLETEWKGTGRRASNLQVVDSLSSWIRMERGTLVTQGVDTVVSLLPLQVMVSPIADRSMVSFVVRVLKAASVQDILSRHVGVVTKRPEVREVVSRGRSDEREVSPR